MTTTTETRTTKAKQVPDFYIFENGVDGAKGGKPAGAAFAHKKGTGFEQHQTVLLDLLAFCTATTINAVQVKADRESNRRLSHAETLASSLSLDMKTWFTPTADNYFNRISKPQILEALREAKGTAPAPAWEKLKKSELAALAERETEGKDWLPEPLRRQ